MARPLRRLSPQKNSRPSEQGDRRSAASLAAERLLSGRHLRIDAAVPMNPGVAATRSAADARTASSPEVEQELLQVATECLSMVNTRSAATAAGAVAPVKPGPRNSAVQKADDQPPASRRQQIATERKSTEEAAQRPLRTSGKAGTARVQLRLSGAVVRILKGFSKAGRHPSAIVERALWDNAAIQDAATILGISRER